MERKASFIFDHFTIPHCSYVMYCVIFKLPVQTIYLISFPTAYPFLPIFFIDLARILFTWLFLYMLLDVTKLRLRSVLKFKIRVLVFVLKAFYHVKLFNKSETIYRRSKNCSDRRAKKLIMAKLVRTIPLFFFAKFQY